MRLIFTILAVALITVSGFCQSPEKMSYQSVIRDADHKSVQNQTVGMQISILQGSTSGTPIYVERQEPVTNENGLVSIEIGTGTTNHNFSDIDWANGPYFVKTETDISGGNNYSIMGISQLLSVPYTLHAKTASSFSGTSKGSLPIYSSGEIVSLAPESGDAIYNTTEDFLQIFNGNMWQSYSTNCWPQPTNADAGPDQLFYSGTTDRLSANAPEEYFGDGKWTIVRGEGGQLSDDTDPQSSFTGKLFERYLLRWTITTNCGSSRDEVIIQYQKGSEAFYQTPQGIDEAIDGIYNALYVKSVHSEEHLASSLLSDLMLDGGGPDDITASHVDAFVDPMEDTYRDLWLQTQNGVFRANAVIEALADADYSQYFNTAEEAEAFRNKSLGEAHFMRGFIMFRAARLFGGLPIIPTTESDRLVPRSSYTDTWAFIADDFKKASEILPQKSAGEYPLEQYGHANVWTAKAYIARAFLHYTGYMTTIKNQATDALPLPNGTNITKVEVISHLEDIIVNSGYALASDFRNLWPYSYVNENARNFDPEGSHPVFPWAENEGLQWVGQDGPNSQTGTGNYEVMFALDYDLADWETGQEFNNRMALFFGIRNHSMVPFGQGWGWGPVHPVFYAEWPENDLRKDGSVLNLIERAPDHGLTNWNFTDGKNNSGLRNKKYTTLQHNGEDGIKGMFYYLYGMTHGDPMQLWAAQDYYYLRFADILLMHSEITETADGLNSVRNRAGLDPVPYSLQALKDERMHEFAFEGIRWFDLVRWGDVENPAKNFYSVTAEVYNSGVAGEYSVTYRPEIEGLMPVPESEIERSNGLYIQNPGW